MRREAGLASQTTNSELHSGAGNIQPYWREKKREDNCHSKASPRRKPTKVAPACRRQRARGVDVVKDCTRLDAPAAHVANFVQGNVKCGRARSGALAEAVTRPRIAGRRLHTEVRKRLRTADHGLCTLRVQCWTAEHFAGHRTFCLSCVLCMCAARAGQQARSRHLWQSPSLLSGAVG